MQSGVTIYLLTCTSMDIYVDYQRAALQFNQLNTEVVLRIHRVWDFIHCRAPKTKLAYLLPLVFH